MICLNLKIKKSKMDYEITINLKHAFFKPFTENKEFISIMTKLVIAMVLAELDALFISQDGRVGVGDIRRKMNKILERIVTGEKEL